MINGGIIIRKIIFFDTETTGLDSRNCQIIELAMITIVDGKIVDEYDEFIKINGLLPQKIVDITGITDKMLEDEGLEEKVVANDLKERLTQNTLMIAHNAQFDLSFVYNLLKRHYPLQADEIVRNMDWLDTLTVFKDRAKYPHKLIDAVKHYEIDEVNFHRAIDDTKALVDVTKAMKNERDDLTEYINIFGYNPKWGVSGEKFPFIEYKKQFYNNYKVSQDDILPRK
ncbi:3'-5' exonuclease [Methanobrevibacter sp.]